MKRFLALLSTLLLALNLWACGGSGSSHDSPPTPTALYSIQGTVTLNGTALSNITIALSGDEHQTITSDDNGSFTFPELEAGSYVVIPSTATGYRFEPESIPVVLAAANMTDQDFTASWVSAAVFLHYYLPDQYGYVNSGGTAEDEAEALFSGYTLTEGIVYSDTETVSGYALEQFIDEDAVYDSTPDPDVVLTANDPRQLYAVVVRSNQDGFSNRSKFISSGFYNPDLDWDTFTQGYLLDMNYTGKTFFPAEIGLVKMYNTKYAYDLYMFRKIGVKRPDADGTIAIFEPQATTDNYVDDTVFTTTTTLATTKFTVETRSFGDYQDVKAISMDQFLTGYVTDNPSAYTYKIVALDGSAKEGWTYAEMQQAYYLPDLDLIVQADASNNIVDDTKINYPVRVELITSDGSPVEYDYTSADPPAFAKAYDE